MTIINQLLYRHIFSCSKSAPVLSSSWFPGGQSHQSRPKDTQCEAKVSSPHVFPRCAVLAFGWSSSFVCCSLACLDTCPQQHNERNLGLVWFQVLTSLGFLGHLTCSSLSDFYSLRLDGLIECLTLMIMASVCWVPIGIAGGSQLTRSHVSVKKTCSCYNQLPGFSFRSCDGRVLPDRGKVMNAPNLHFDLRSCLLAVPPMFIFVRSLFPDVG